MKSDDCCTATEATTTAALAPGDRARSRPVVEVLYFDGCPNHEPSVALVERVAKELGLQPEIRLVNVTDAAAAARLRFLGSPTVRIDGCDIEPGAEQRTDFALSCRVFRTERGFSGEPDEQWVRDALLRERAVSSEISAARHLEASPRIAEALAADFLSKHLDVPEVDMEHIATALSERGYAVDSASGKLVHPPSNRPLRR